MNFLQLHQRPGVYLVLAAFLLVVGIYGLIRRRTLIGMLIAGELIFSAASLNLMAVNRFFAPDPTVGQIFVLFIMGLAAAEVIAGVIIAVCIYIDHWRHAGPYPVIAPDSASCSPSSLLRRSRAGDGHRQTAQPPRDVFIPRRRDALFGVVLSLIPMSRAAPRATSSACPV